VIKAGIARDTRALRALLDPFDPGQGPFVIVPNWHTAREGYGTDASTLRCLLEALPGEKILVESYDAARTDDPGRFQDLGLDAARRHWDYLKRQDEIFLDQTGIGEVLGECDAQYLNVTEEIWAGRAAPADQVKALVEERHGAVARPELYGMVPQQLWDCRGGTLINCAKIKALPMAGGVFFSLSMKNLFGLIPVPSRGEYHGSTERGLSRSIVDMNRIYASLFRTISLGEAMRSTLLSATVGLDDEAALVEDLGLVTVSDRAVELDAFLVHALGGLPGERHFLRLGAEAFGRWDEAGFPALPREVKGRLQEAMHGAPSRSFDPADYV
jgi:uncharacterized protein DUF362